MGACSSKKATDKNDVTQSQAPSAVTLGTSETDTEKEQPEEVQVSVIEACDPKVPREEEKEQTDAIHEDAKHAFYAEKSYHIVKEFEAKFSEDMQAAKWESLSKSSIQLPRFNSSDRNPPYIPSPYSLHFLVPPPATVGFQRYKWEPKYSGRAKILVVATSAYELKLHDEKSFYTGHHTTEIFVPMIHLHDAGFEFIIATIDGKPVCLEDWTFPIAEGYEADLRGMAKTVEKQLKNPQKTSEVEIVRDNVVAVFMPGGHGAMIQSGNDPAVGKLLRAAHDNEVLTAAICHGGHTLVAARLGNDGEFPYRGYEAVCFPDYIDEPVAQQKGYLPAKMITLPQKDLRDNGVDVKNTESTNMPMDQVWLDRELLTGLSQASAQKFGTLFVELLMKKYQPSSTAQKVSVPEAEPFPEVHEIGTPMVMLAEDAPSADDTGNSSCQCCVWDWRS